jgi:hypothetical protein
VGAANRSRRRYRLASTVEIVAQAEGDLAQLFWLAKGAFAGLPGWSDERVLEVLRRDVIFVAREQGRPAGYVALRRERMAEIEGGFTAPPKETTFEVFTQATARQLHRGRQDVNSPCRPRHRPADAF